MAMHRATTVAAALVGAALLSGCAARVASGAGGGVRDPEALAGVESVAVARPETPGGALLLKCLTELGEPRPAAAGEKTPHVATLELRCGQDFAFMPVEPMHPLCMGYTEDDLSVRQNAPERAHPSCEGILTVYEMGRPIWQGRQRMAMASPDQAEGLVRKLAEDLAADRRRARETGA
jgi:hypothetical protein